MPDGTHLSPTNSKEQHSLADKQIKVVELIKKINKKRSNKHTSIHCPASKIAPIPIPVLIAVWINITK